MATVTDPVSAGSSPPHDQVDAAANLARVKQRIGAAGGDPERIVIVGVTKGFGRDAVEAALAAGVHDLGENYAQELLAKAGAGLTQPGLTQPGSTQPGSAQPGSTQPWVGEPIRWHFLGPVQRNKVAALAPVVSLWHAIDRVAAGEAIARRRRDARVLVQVNVSGEPGKHGCRVEEAPDLVKALRGLGLDVAGLMAVGPAATNPADGPERARPGFRALARLAQQLGLGELSMGMTEDLEVAVQEGATMVRIGRALFGPRTRRARLRG